MSRSIGFTDAAWQDYLYWQLTDKTIAKKINRLIQDCQREPFAGIGKPEPLKHELNGAWSRRIDNEHRLVYLIDKNMIRIIACRYHY